MVMKKNSLQQMGVTVEDVHDNKPEAADKMILSQIIKILLEEEKERNENPNKDTFTLVLISGDRDFCRPLAFLHARWYINIIYLK